MKKKNIIIIGIFVLAIPFLGAVLVKGSNDKWICKDGQWTRQGSPKVSQPQKPCPGARIGEELPSIPPDSTVVSFYNWLTKNANAIATGSYKTSPYLADSCKQKIPQLTQNNKYNPFVCSNKSFTSYKMLQSSVKNRTASINVEETFGTGKKIVVVQLQTQGKNWKIQNITCP